MACIKEPNIIILYYSNEPNYIRLFACITVLCPPPPHILVTFRTPALLYDLLCPRRRAIGYYGRRCSELDTNQLLKDDYTRKHILPCNEERIQSITRTKPWYQTMVRPPTFIRRTMCGQSAGLASLMITSAMVRPIPQCAPSGNERNAQVWPTRRCPVCSG